MRQLYFRRAHGLSASRHALTLIEMLVALAVTLIIMAAVSTMFGNVSNSIVGARASIETNQRHRAATDRLRADLAGLICMPFLWQRGDGTGGYLEILEGPGSDANPPPSSPATADIYKDFVERRLLGDVDDAIFMTVRSTGAPFVGKPDKNGVVMTSPIAEVIWYTRTLPNPAVAGQAPTVPWRNLYRRLLLVMPDADVRVVAGTNIDDFQTKYDLSARQVGSTVVLNSLSDLARRECRFQHAVSGQISGVKNWPAIKTLAELDTTKTRSDEDIILTHVLGFDLKVWDPAAPVYVTSGLALAPGDLGYPKSGTAAAYGAYVDLHYGGASYFGTQNSTSVPPPTSYPNAYPATYDTWNSVYESTTYNSVAVSTDGLDSDDPGERKSAAPFPYALRGVQIKVRTYEPDSRQVRESTTHQSFVPD